MELSLDGYRFERVIRRSATTAVWQAIRERDHLPVIAKVFAIEDRAGLEARVEHEFELIRHLELPGVVRALTLERAGPYLVLILEAQPGVNLAEYAQGRPLPLPRFFDLACQLVAIVAAVHEQRIIHRDLKPTNILVVDDARVVLADFGISVLLESERHHIHDRTLIEGTLPYMSPEQTGRTGREVDFRSDLYSLGVSFYELLTGRRPLLAASPLELIHAHLARRPEPPQQLRPELPTALSRLVMKLLEKAPERRYQSASGLLHDLERMREGGELGPDFPLGQTDVPTSLQLPHQLYGRERERERLRETFHRSLAGPPILAVIAGEPGVGKSVLLDDFAELLAAERGFFARGKCDEDNDEPLWGLRTALANLADQLLIEPPDALETWRERLRTTLGAMTAVICELVPRFAALLGHREPARDDDPLTADEARNRIWRGCQRLLAAFAGLGRPLLLAIDDLQWADPATVEALARLCASEQAGLALVVGARSSALAEGGTLAGLIADLEHAAQTQDDRPAPLIVELGPLSSPQLAALIGDILSMPADAVGSLAEVVARKTDGNPFFANQFMLDLCERGLLRREPAGWTWDVEALAAAALPKDALELMTRKLERLPAVTRAVALASAVIGSTVDARILAALVDDEAIDALLLQLVDHGLLTPIPGGGFGFSHERVREAAYALLDEPTRQRWHLAIGRWQLRADPAQIEAQLFEIVEHHQRGLGLLERLDDASLAERTRALSTAERQTLVALEHRAGRRALATGAPAAARFHLRIAAAAAEAEHGFEIELALAEAEALTGSSQEASARLRRLLEGALPPVELARAARARCWVLLFCNEMAESVRVGITAVRRLGVHVPLQPGRLDALRSLIEIRWMLRDATVGRLASLAPASDPAIQAAMDILAHMANASYIASPEAFVVLAACHAKLILRHGSSPSAPLVFAQLGLVAANAFGRRREAVALSAICLELAADSRLRYRVLQNQTFVRLWTDPYHALLEPLVEVGELALTYGDVPAAETAGIMALNVACYGGLHLRLLERRVDERRLWSQQWGTVGIAGRETALARVCQLLITGPLPDDDDPEPLASPGAGENDFASIDNRLLTTFVFAIAGRWDAAFARIDGHIAAIERSMPGTWYVPIARVLWGLACGDRAQRSHGRERRLLRRRLDNDTARLRRWCEAGGNFVHCAEILAGELAVVDGDLPAAARHFEQARGCALEQRNSIYAALASERLARALLAAAQPRLAIGPLLDARAHYLNWGAFAKVEALDDEYPALLGGGDELIRDPGSASSSVSKSSSKSSGSAADNAIDMASLIKASQSLAGDIRLAEVAARVLDIALENAGGDRGLLVMASHAEDLRLVAESSLEHGTEVSLEQAPALAEVAARLPVSLLHWVARTREDLVIEHTSDDRRFAADPYFTQAKAGFSALCLPIVKRGRLVGLLYLENKLSDGAFTSERIELLRVLTGQVASALENARLYDELRTSEVRWRSLVDQLPDLVIVADRDGHLGFANGERGAEALRQGERGPELDAALSRILAGGALERLELPLSFHGGLPRWHAVRMAPIVIDGEIERAIIVCTDIEERKRAEIERARLESQLLQQQRLESIGTLASGVAHEINNPIQGIMNYAELIAESAAADELIREFALEIDIETKRVATIVRNLLAFSRQELSEAKIGNDVTAIIEGTLTLIRAVLRKDQIDVEVHIPPSLPEVLCRRQQIQQVIMNLVTNARDALNARYEGFHDDKRIEISAEVFSEDASPWVRIVVADRAGGIPADVIGRIYDPFFTTKGRDQGTGLGLAMSHGIVNDHGGRLVLDNQIGVGARFCVELPCLGTPEQATREAGLSGVWTIAGGL